MPQVVEKMDGKEVNKVYAGPQYSVALSKVSSRPRASMLSEHVK